MQAAGGATAASAGPATIDGKISLQSIRAIAQTMGIAHLDDKVAQRLAQDVDYRLREMVQDSTKFMLHSNRKRLLPADIDSALRLRNVEPLYGFSSSDPITFRKAGEDLFYVEDVVVGFDAVINEALPKIPIDSSIHLHWLAIEGVQPLVPENPHPSLASSSAAFDDAANKKRKGEQSISQQQQQSQQRQHPKEVVPLVEHVLSKEQQVFYLRVTEAIKGTDKALKAEALRCLRHDAGLHQLLPYFVQFIVDEIMANRRNVRVLTALMHMASSLILCRHLQIEPYLHQIMPGILTCVVGKRLSASPAENHWSLREYAAKLIAIVCHKYGHAYIDLQPRVTKTFASALLDPSKALTQHYGAIVGLAALGPRVTKALLLPYLSEYLCLLEEVISKKEKPTKVAEARQCYGALLSAVGSALVVSDGEPSGTVKAAKKNKDEEEEASKGKKTLAASKKKKRATTGRGRNKRQKMADKAEEEEEDEDKEVKPKTLAESALDAFGEGLLPYLPITRSSQVFL